MTNSQSKQAATELQEALNQLQGLTEAWVTAQGDWVGVALTVEEALVLTEMLEQLDEG